MSQLRRRGAARAALAAALIVSLASACNPVPDGPRSVLLVTFDTTRADHLGPYGDSSAHTPALDRLAAEGTVFEHCKSSAPITVPSHSTILTGTYPNVHGVRDNGLYVLSEERTTLPEILGEAGLRTAAAISSFVLDAQFGTAQGFELYDDEVTAVSESFWGARTDEKKALFFDERPADDTVDAILPWLRERSAAGESFFLWVHLWSPHHPLIPPAPWNELFATDLYRGEIAAADAALGRLLDELESLGEAEDTVVVMASDHGEGHGEHGEETHALLAHDATLHVPLIVKVPGRADGGGRRVAERVGTVDIMPTVLELLGQPIPESVQGRSLVPLLVAACPPGQPGSGPANQEPANRRPYYAETLSPRLSHGWGELRAWYEGPWKYVHGPRPELYHLASDPDELDNRTASEPEIEASMRGRLADYLRSTSRPLEADSRPGVDPEVRARLEALGYLSSGGDGPESITDVLRDDGTPPQDRVGDLNLWSRAKQHLARGEYLAAKDAVAPLLELAGENSVYRTLAAWAEMGLGQDQDAIRLLERTPADGEGGRFIEVPGRYDSVVARLAARQAADGDRDAALELLNPVLAARPAAPLWQQRAELFRVSDPAEFERSLEAALAVDAGFAPARLELAATLLSRGEHAAAAEHYVRALEDNPRSARGHHNYGALLAAQGHWPEARRHFSRAVDLAPIDCLHRVALLTAVVELGESAPAAEVRRAMDDFCAEDQLAQADALLEELAARGELFEILSALEESE